jgi:hypothetical protein
VICLASSVRPSFADDASKRSSAEATVVQPFGRGGSGKRSRARELSSLFDLTFSVESVPELVDGLP